MYITGPGAEICGKRLLEALVEGAFLVALANVDPMTLLTVYKERLCETPSAATQPVAPAEETPGHDNDTVPTADVAQKFSIQSLSAAAFDPLATSGDGVMVTPGLGDEPPPQPPPPRQDPPPESVLRRQPSARTQRNRQRLLHCLESDDIDLQALRGLAWKGVPSELRPIVWPLLLNYLPASASIRTSTLARKRAEYAAGVERAFARGTAALDRAIWHQIRIDVPRTNPGIRLWQQEATQRALERILYVWAIRHPASGYVQGINDLATPFFEVFLSAYIDGDPEKAELAALPTFAREALEADTFWCLSKLLDGIQDNYISAQPGILRQLRLMGEVVARIDAPLHKHLAEQGVEYVQFSFRWMNCLLMREMSVKNIIRMWDTYLVRAQRATLTQAEGADAFSDFHPYVCAVLLHKWSTELRTMDFQSIIMFLQSLPTQSWGDADAEMLLSEAFMFKALFGNSAHVHR